MTPIHPITAITYFALAIVLNLALEYRRHLREERKLRTKVLAIMMEKGDTTPPEEVSVKITGSTLATIAESVMMAFGMMGAVTLCLAIYQAL